MKRPVSAVGLLIMIACVVVGFKPTMISMLLLFVVTLFGGHMIKKHAPESYDGFVVVFGYMASIFCFVAAGMLWFAFELPYIDRVSHAFLPFMAGVVMITLIKNNRKDG